MVSAKRPEMMLVRKTVLNALFFELPVGLLLLRPELLDGMLQGWLANCTGRETHADAEHVFVASRLDEQEDGKKLVLCLTIQVSDGLRFSLLGSKGDHHDRTLAFFLRDLKLSLWRRSPRRGRRRKKNWTRMAGWPEPT